MSDLTAALQLLSTHPPTRHAIHAIRLFYAVDLVNSERRVKKSSYIFSSEWHCHKTVGSSAVTKPEIVYHTHFMPSMFRGNLYYLERRVYKIRLVVQPVVTVE